MNRFVIVGGLPYLYHDGAVYTVRWDNEGFTVGEKVELPETPTVIYSELSVKAKCDVLCSIPSEEQIEPEQEIENDTEEQIEPEQAEPKKTRRSRQKAVKAE